MKKPTNVTKNDWELLTNIYKGKEEYLKEMLDKNYPIQYLIGYVNFCGLKINVNENVLIPRFETELLIEKTIKYINELNLKKPTILDIGTGSGCIATSLSKFINDAKVSAMDISSNAINLAKENASNNKENINFIKKDVLKMEEIPYYDVVISNPPYVEYGEKIGEEVKYEPEIAVYADDGLIFYRHIIKSIHKDTKLIAFEIGYLQGAKIIDIIKMKFPNAEIHLEKDYEDRDRFIFVINKNA